MNKFISSKKALPTTLLNKLVKRG